MYKNRFSYKAFTQNNFPFTTVLFLECSINQILLVVINDSISFYQIYFTRKSMDIMFFNHQEPWLGTMSCPVIVDARYVFMKRK